MLLIFTAAIAFALSCNTYLRFSSAFPVNTLKFSFNVDNALGISFANYLVIIPPVINIIVFNPPTPSITLLIPVKNFSKTFKTSMKNSSFNNSL